MDLRNVRFFWSACSEEICVCRITPGVVVKNGRWAGIQRLSEAYNASR